MREEQNDSWESRVLRTPVNEFNEAKSGGAAHLLGGLAGVKSTILHFFLILLFFISTKKCVRFF